MRYQIHVIYLLKKKKRIRPKLLNPAQGYIYALDFIAT
jgi:hypothetical protein